MKNFVFNDRGSALGAALILTVFITMLTFGALLYVEAHVRKMHKIRWDMQAFHFTEEGYRRACWRLLHNDTKTGEIMSGNVDGLKFSRSTSCWAVDGDPGTYNILVSTKMIK